MTGIVLTVLAAVVVTIVLGIRFFQRATQDISLVRSGLGGTRAAIGGGMLIVPMLHNVTRVNMNTMRLELTRTHDKALITGDRMRADVVVEFYVRVRAEREAVELAAQTLGSRTLNPEHLKALVEGKFVDALRSVAAEKTMEELHANRREFARAVAEQVGDGLGRNGLELDTVSITALDQTDIKYFNPSNAFDAEGLTWLTEQIETRKKKRNDIEQDTAIALQRKTLETEKSRLDLEKESEYARLQQQYDIADRRAQQQAEIAETEARSHAAAEQSQLDADQALEARRVYNDQRLGELRAQRDAAVEVSRLHGVIEQSAKEQEQNQALAALAETRGRLELANEHVETLRETEIAQRDKAIEVIKAAREAERETEHARIHAHARRDRVEIEAEERKLRAAAEAEAERLTADGDMARQQMEAEAMRLLNEARNALSEEQTQADMRRRLIDALPDILRASGEPLKHVDSIRIAKVDGLQHGQRMSPDSTDGGRTANSGQASELLSALMDYRAQAPVVDAILREVGLAGDGSGLSVDSLSPRPTDARRPRGDESETDA
ncbi:flotillin family protein [Aquisalimonas sp. 2447]|uniref:flotillin family protein n=1 Tax=Aquisalimonas sp. 2447 TaxID=2740807 RepID=UPI0014323BBC|nr:flotillin domain-containing protein [Aquisalimonas sp. 2447]QIT54005.1 flotillin family protein [Aquisalimonas sp. 2447]